MRAENDIGQMQEKTNNGKTTGEETKGDQDESERNEKNYWKG